MKHYILSTSLLSLLLLPIYSEAQSWTISNDQIRRTIVFTQENGLYTKQIDDLGTGTSFIQNENAAKPGREFSFVCNGKALSGAGHSFRMLSAKETSFLDGKLLTISLQALSTPLNLSVNYRVYNGHPAIRKWIVLKNNGTENLVLSHMNFEAINPTVGPANETILNAQYGSAPRELLYTGRSEDAGLLISNARTGNGFAILSEVPGYMKRTEIDGFYDPGRIHIGVEYDTDLMPFERSLRPGEEFTTAAVSFLTFRNDAGFHDPRWILPSYTAKVLQSHVSRTGAPWIYNTWSPFKRTINEKTTVELVDIASSLGMDIFTIDDGWLKQYGDNSPDRAAFPGGIEPIRKVVEDKGMRLGLWMPLAAIDIDSKEYLDHPDWQALDQSGKQKRTDTAGGSKVVMCMASSYRDVAAARINEAIERYHLAYVKLDLTTIFNTYGEAPGCWAKGHKHENWAQSLTMTYEGISSVTKQIYAKHPDVLIDLTFELWGQKHVIDAGLLAAGDLDWISNVNDTQADSAGPIQARTILYQRSTSMPVEGMLIGNLQAETASVAEHFATATGSAPLLLGDLRKLTPDQRAWYREHIRWFKTLRQSIPLEESFFPLGSWRQPNSTQWDGFARLARTGAGIICLFSNASIDKTATVAISVMPPGRFRVHSTITNTDLGTFSAQDWKDGIQVPLLSTHTAQILEVFPTD